MGQIDEAALDERLAMLEGARQWSPRTIAKLEALLHATDDAQLVRVNPLSFARERGLSADEALDLFLHATRAGLFTMDWHLLCPLCGAAVESFASLRALHQHLFCALCDAHTDANLDDYIQVSFTVAPTVRRIAFHDPAALPVNDFLFKLRYTREARIGSPDGPRFVDLAPDAFLLRAWVSPGEAIPFAIEAGPGELAAADFHAHAGAKVRIDADAPAVPLHFEIRETNLSVSSERVRAGRIEGSVTNQRSVRVVIAVAHKPDAILMDGTMTQFEPFVTGAMLLANQTFRRLFRAETVASAEGIGLRDVTVLFTDLKGSTALYERIGDLKAFTLVQQHFERLATAVQANSGAIVKTIGDAVMAAFVRPADAVRAAVQMQQQIDRFNREHDARDIVLKIGIHRGPSIAVTLNDNLDYFGHTVNVAARVQGLADADEIYLTDEVLRAPGVDEIVAPVASHAAQLRGLQREVQVHKVAPRP